MSLEPAATKPTTIGPYRVEREIARGGMGIVYEARDLRLDRTVAIKAMPDDVAADPERMARFEREARVLASLNHPNIAGIYGLEESEGRRYLALEHVQGETLADRLRRGPLPVGEAIDLCIQIAAGIEAAHEAGVVHRDLKPGNVMITPGDTAKVLDFGLAKGRVAPESGILDSPAIPSSPGLPNSPTLASPTPFPQSPTMAHSPTLAHSPTFGAATMPGVILGTAGYLSPEQARGKPVDRRTDIWSFGCVLYECLTGKLAFDGETVSDTIAKILEREVDWTALPKNTPPRVTELLHRCLEKDARRRLRDIGDARLALEEVKTGRGAAGTDVPGADAAARARSRRRAGRIAVALPLGAFILGLLVGGLFLGRRLGDGDGGGVKRLSVTFPADLRVLGMGMTPDERHFIAIAAPKDAKSGSDTDNRLYMRTVDGNAFEPVKGTERIQAFNVSPDSRWIQFTARPSERSPEIRIFKMPVDRSLPPAPVVKREDDWSGNGMYRESGTLLFATANGREYVEVSLEDGTVSKPKKFVLAGFDGAFAFSGPYSLPGDRAALIAATYYEKGLYQQSIGAVDLENGEVKILTANAGSAKYLEPGYLLFTRGDALLAARFDPKKLELKGSPVALLDGLRMNASWGHAGYQLTPGGTLLHAPGGNAAKDRHLTIIDPQGKVSEWSGERQPFEASVSLSPAGDRVASVVANTGAIYEIWISERGRPNSRRIVAIEGVDCSMPTWSPDGSKIAYIRTARNDEDGVYVVDADGTGTPRRIAKGSREAQIIPTSWFPDGTQILVTAVKMGKPGLGMVAASGADELDPRDLLPGPGRKGMGRFSPDGRAMAYMSDEMGSFDVFVCAWEGGGPVGPSVAVSSGGGGSPVWSRDGSRLYYLSPQNKMMSAAIQRAPRLTVSQPVEAWDLDQLRIVPQGGGIPLFDALPGGGMVAIRKGDAEDDITRFEVVLNFDEELKTRVR
ncbi:MAG TPA: protein kinase [Candidatus Eisenbacteria bacterium]|nr:protein kinase [Candidatus Eisenbacteria bacterium]